MILKQLSIINFKNIAQAELSFSANINCFLGNNGMGKSNLLDAIYYLSFCKSFTHVNDSQNIRHGEEFFMLQGVYDRNDATETLSCGIRRKQKKSFKRNKKEYERLSDHIGFAPLVMVSPDDSILIRGGGEERRRFIDVVISQWDKPYLDSLIRYNKALEQRNALIRQQVGDPSLYEIWEEQMARAASRVYDTRQRFLEAFIPVFNRFYNHIAAGNEQVGLAYRSHLAEGDLLPQLAASRSRDLLIGYTTKGIHRDDMEMTLDDYPMKRIGSQGQCKTYLVALKLAQYEFLAQHGNTTPILLLDDLFDKLDAERVERIMRLVASDVFGQIFITDTNREYLDQIVRQTTARHSLFNVVNGEFSSL